MLSGLLGVLVATNQPAALSNLVHEKTGAKIEVGDSTSPIEQEYLRLLLLDQAAQDDVEKMFEENDKLAAAGVGDSAEAMRRKARQRFEPVENAYREFLKKNPNHLNGRIAFGSFLNDQGRESEAAEQYLKARDLDPKNAAVWNNLGNFYGHNSPVTNAFACYEKAIELNPNEQVYHQNFATTVYLFRRDATNYFRITEQQVFDKAMAHYRRALTLSSNDFKVATDLAQTYYGIQPPRVKEALEAWKEALKLAGDEAEREGVRIHLARWYRTAGDTIAARRELDLVTNPIFATTKQNILRSLEKLSATNSPARVP